MFLGMTICCIVGGVVCQNSHKAQNCKLAIEICTIPSKFPVIKLKHLSSSAVDGVVICKKLSSLCLVGSKGVRHFALIISFHRA